MNNILPVVIITFILSGCAGKMAYLNTQKPPEEVEKDKSDCQAKVDSSDFKDADLKKNEFNQRMKDKSYNVVSENKAQKLQGFDELWVKPGIDFKSFKVIYVAKVDIEEVKVKNMQMPGTKVTEEDIENLGTPRKICNYRRPWVLDHG